MLHLLFNVLGFAFVTVFVVFPLLECPHCGVAIGVLPWFLATRFTWSNFDFLFEMEMVSCAT